VHKFFIINKLKITSIEGNEINLDKVGVPIGQKLKDEIMPLILGNKYLKK
jgi:hypothetical protein